MRTANTPFTETAALLALRQVIVPNTQLAQGSVSGTGLEQVYVQSRYLLSQGSFPAVSLYAKPSTSTLLSRHLMGSVADLVVEYYDRWDEQPQTQDTLWSAISLDLERMAANIENNDILAVGGEQYLAATLKLSFSPYDRVVERGFPGLALLCRSLTLSVVLPEYLV